MIKIDDIKKMNTQDRLKYMVLLVKSQLGAESDFISNLSNISAIIKECIGDTNWTGFYLYKEGELKLGPFQGKPACNKIAIGKGVCGTSFKENKTIIVPDVHAFEGHIPCDSNTNSEIVVPLIKDEKLLGVIDLDSEKINRFSELEKFYLEKVRDEIIKKY